MCHPPPWKEKTRKYLDTNFLISAKPDPYNYEVTTLEDTVRVGKEATLEIAFISNPQPAYLLWNIYDQSTPISGGNVTR